MQLVGPGIESGPLAMKIPSPNSWTTREFPSWVFFVVVVFCFFPTGMWSLSKSNNFKWDNQGSFPKNISFEPKKKKRIKRENKHAHAYIWGRHPRRNLQCKGPEAECLGFWKNEVSVPEQGSGVSRKRWDQRSSKWPGHGTTFAFTLKEMGSYWRAKK